MTTIRPICVLVGAPGAGKSTVGVLAAEALHVRFRDIDTDIESIAGKSIAEVFFDQGEAAFRDIERRVVEEALLTHPGVLALSSGSVIDDEVRARLAGHTVAFLSVGLAAATRRISLGGGQVAGVSARSALRAMLDQRNPLYEQVATLTIPTDDRSADEVVAELLAKIRAVARTS